MRSRLRHAPRHASPAFKFNVWIARGARGARARAPVTQHGVAYMPAAEELPSVLLSAQRCVSSKSSASKEDRPRKGLGFADSRFDRMCFLPT